MKFTIAPLLLSSVFASKAGKLAKFPKVKAKAAKSAYAYGSMSASMSVGPEPPITPSPTPTPTTLCGEIFTNQKVVLTDNLDCGGPRPPGQFIDSCAVTLDGPKAEIDCNGNTLSQEATSPFYTDGPYNSGICLNNGATAINCNVQQFRVMELVSRMVMVK
jgi:hypothetical protein